MNAADQNLCSSPLRKKRKSDEDQADTKLTNDKHQSGGVVSGTAGSGTAAVPPHLERKQKAKPNANDKGNNSSKVTSGVGSNQAAPVLSDKRIFDGDAIFVLDSGIGKARTNLFKKQIKNNGGKVVETYSSEGEITHVIVDDNMDPARMCRILGIKEGSGSLSSVNTVKCSWLTACLKEKRTIDLKAYILDTSIKETNDNANREQAGDVSNTNENKKIKGESSSATSSRTYLQFGGGKSRDVEENLADSDYNSSDDEGGQKSEFLQPSTSAFAPKRPLPKGSWACAKASGQVQVNHNKNVTDKLEALAKIYENTNDKWRALGYSKAIAALKRCPKKITTYEEAKALSGVGDKLANKVWEIIESGELRKLEEISSSSEIQAINLFTNIWGAGAATARQWVSLGYRTLDDIRTKASLNKQQKIGLMYYDELLDRMSREEAGEIEATVKEAALKINPGLICQACGSYRRGKATCGDVDVLVTHPDGKSHVGIFTKILASLHESGFLTDDLVKQEDESTQKKYLGVCILPGENRKHRRLDIIVVPYNEYACALMYFTGSAHFNRSMRHLAGKMNMSLSEHSLNAGVVRSRGEKVNKGTPLPTPTEESVFKHLGLPYRSPEDRNH